MKIPSPESKLVRRLASSSGHLVVDSDGILFRSKSDAAGTPVDPTQFRRLRASGALQERAHGNWVLSAPGRSLARRLLTQDHDMAAQHQMRGRQVIAHDGEAVSVAVDLGESPLAWLRARKGRDGAPLIDDAAFAAGERLRADFTRGQLMPRVTANWDLAAPAGRRSSSAGGLGELTDAALAARLRVERALAALGPELAGLVLDFCCFLKRIETIEHERGWPKRSARLVLQLALAALARHYGFARSAVGPSAPYHAAARGRQRAV